MNNLPSDPSQFFSPSQPEIVFAEMMELFEEMLRPLFADRWREALETQSSRDLVCAAAKEQDPNIRHNILSQIKFKDQS